MRPTGHQLAASGREAQNQRAMRRASEAHALKRQGLLPVEIAARIGVTKAQVWNYLRKPEPSRLADGTWIPG